MLRKPCPKCICLSRSKNLKNEKTNLEKSFLSSRLWLEKLFFFCREKNLISDLTKLKLADWNWIDLGGGGWRVFYHSEDQQGEGMALNNKNIFSNCLSIRWNIPHPYKEFIKETFENRFTVWSHILGNTGLKSGFASVADFLTLFCWKPASPIFWTPQRTEKMRRFMIEESQGG